MITTYILIFVLYILLDSDTVAVPLFLQPQLTVVPSVTALSVGRESLDCGCALRVGVVARGQLWATPSAGS